MKNERFIKVQKILHLATVDTNGIPHIVPVWYLYRHGKFFIGTNINTQKAKNISKNSKVSFCIDIGIKSPDIIGMMGTGRAKLILKMDRVEILAKNILLRYFKTMKNKSAQSLLRQTDCIIEITPKRTVNWKY